MIERKINRSILSILILILVAIASQEIPSLSFSHIRIEEKAAIEIGDYYSYVERVDSVSFFVTVGEIRNNSTVNVKSIIINATYYDKNDGILGEGYGYPALDVLKPSLRCPFIIYWNIKSSQDTPARVKLTCQCTETNEAPIPVPQVESLANHTDADGYFVVEGEIRNVGSSKAYDIRVFCSYYYANGTLIRILWTGLGSDVEVEVDQTTTFQISSKPFKMDLARYEVLAVARYKPKMVVRFELLLVLIGVFFVFLIYMKKYRGW